MKSCDQAEVTATVFSPASAMPLPEELENSLESLLQPCGDRMIKDVDSRTVASMRSAGLDEALLADPGRFPTTRLRDLWVAYDTAMAEVGPPAVTGRTFLRNYCRIKRNTGARLVPHRDWVLRGYLLTFGQKGCIKQRIRLIFGADLLEDTFDRLCQIAGITVKKEVRRKVGSEDELMELFPDEARPLLRAHLRQDIYPEIPPINKNFCSRVCRLNGDPTRVLLGLGLISATAKGTCESRQRDLLGHGETLGDLFADQDMQDEAALSERLHAFLSGAADPAEERKRQRCARDWFFLQREASSLAKLLLGDDHQFLTSLLPAFREPDERFAALFEDIGKRQKRSKKERSEKKGQEVHSMIERLTDIQAAVENRFFMLEGMMRNLMSAMSGAANIADGRAGFDWTGPIIRADGTLAPGEQTVSFDLVPESELFRRALDKFLDDRALTNRLPRNFQDDPRFSGAWHRHDRWNRVHLVYRGTAPCSPGDECVEPFFVELFRRGAFEPDYRSGDEESLIRTRLLESMRLPHYNYPIEGLLSHPKDDRIIARYSREAHSKTGERDIIIPLASFYHAMAYARIVLRFGIRWGARIGETAQLRVGCAKTHKRGGRDAIYVELLPKGWDVMGKFGMDAGTAKAIASIRAFTNQRWHGGRLAENREPWLPTVAPGDERRKNIADAAYFFQNATRAMTPTELVRFARVLLFGILDFDGHDERRVFATALGLNGHGYDTIGPLLHHSPGSAMPATYDFSSLIVSDDAAEAFNASMDAGAVGTAATGG